MKYADRKGYRQKKLSVFVYEKFLSGRERLNKFFYDFTEMLTGRKSRHYFLQWYNI